MDGIFSDFPSENKYTKMYLKYICHATVSMVQIHLHIYVLK